MKLRGSMLVGAVAMLGFTAAPAHAVHLFPATPVFDPLGHDCAKSLSSAPATAPGGEVFAAGFSFVDYQSGSSTTTIAEGESVTWDWLADHCHSVTFSGPIDPDPEDPDQPPTTTYGATGFMPAQPELVRWGADGGHHYSLTFPQAGTYSYLCVHHAGVGMVGTVEVTPVSGS